MNTDDLKNRFTYHPPQTDEMVEKFGEIRSFALDYARFLNEVCVESRELSLAITHLEEVVFWANAAIARHENPPE